jgi:DNA-binding NarL/FixJ family response regulator
LIATGMSNAEVAAELTLEVSTVKSHISRLLSRLGLPNRERLIAFAWRSGVVDREG